MTERTKKQIAAEIKALEACKQYIPHFTAFNDDNWERVDLQIECLRDDIDMTADEFLERSEDDQSAIMEAQSWKEGDANESPSSGWDSYKPKAAKRAKA
jgi:hypothetical protein